VIRRVFEARLTVAVLAIASGLLVLATYDVPAKLDSFHDALTMPLLVGGVCWLVLTVVRRLLLLSRH
jgi:hypothetical protein